MSRHHVDSTSKPRLASLVAESFAVRLCLVITFVLFCYNTAPGHALHPLTIDAPAPVAAATIHH